MRRRGGVSDAAVSGPAVLRISGAAADFAVLGVRGIGNRHDGSRVKAAIEVYRGTGCWWH